MVNFGWVFSGGAYGRKEELRDGNIALCAEHFCRGIPHQEYCRLRRQFAFLIRIFRGRVLFHSLRISAGKVVGARLYGGEVQTSARYGQFYVAEDKVVPSFPPGCRRAHDDRHSRFRYVFVRCADGERLDGYFPFAVRGGMDDLRGADRARMVFVYDAHCHTHNLPLRTSSRKKNQTQGFCARYPNCGIGRGRRGGRVRNKLVVQLESVQRPARFRRNVRGYALFLSQPLSFGQRVRGKNAYGTCLR